MKTAFQAFVFLLLASCSGGGCNISWPGVGAAPGRMKLETTQLCPSTPVSLSWTGGDANTRIVDPNGEEIASGSSGEYSGTAKNGRYTLRSGSTVIDGVTVSIHPSSFDSFIPFSASCGRLTSDLFGLQGTYLMNGFDPAMRVTAIQNTSRSLIELTHDGQAADIFAGTYVVPSPFPVRGTYIAVSPLEDWESCESAVRSFALNIGIRCQ